MGALAFIAMTASSSLSWAAGAPGENITSYYRNGSFILPTDTNPLITATGFAHYVRLPTDVARRKSALVVFLGGSQSLVPSYTDITQEAAIRGYGAIDLAYMDAQLGGVACSEESPSFARSPSQCYGQFHGEVVIGRDQAYDPSATSGYGAQRYSMQGQSVDPLWLPIGPADAVIGRLVSLLEYLARSNAYFEAGTSPAQIEADHRYWFSFLEADANSPYSATIDGVTYRAYPDWSRIVVAGHSQGAAHAAFIASHLPDRVRGAVLFSGPQDGSGKGAAAWIGETSTTPLQKYWVVRNGTNDSLRAATGQALGPPGLDAVSESSSSTEGSLGDRAMSNWNTLGSIGVGGNTNGGSEYVLSDAGACLASHECSPGKYHRLVIMSSSKEKSALQYHDSTAVNGSYEANSTEYVWDRLFTLAGGS